MGLVTAGVIAAGAALYAANKASNASSNAAKAQTNAANAAINQQNLNYNRTADNLNPYLSSGTNALNQINQLNSGDYSSFKASPDYQFTLNQGLQGLDRSAASRGNLFSGGQSADVLNYAQGLASQQYNNYYSKLASLAQSGQNAASNLGSVGAGQSAAIGSYLTNAGNAQANNATNQGNIGTNTTNQLAGLAGQWLGGLNKTTNPTDSQYAGALSPSQNYTGTGSLSTSWPGMTGGLNTNTQDTTWAGMGGGWSL